MGGWLPKASGRPECLLGSREGSTAVMGGWSPEEADIPHRAPDTEVTNSSVVGNKALRNYYISHVRAVRIHSRAVVTGLFIYSE